MHTLSTREVTIALLMGYKQTCKTTSDPNPDSPAGTSLKHMAWMCDQAFDNQLEWPMDKLSRWLGFIQGVLIMKGIIEAEHTRNITRPMFHAAYTNEGIAIPETLTPESA